MKIFVCLALLVLGVPSARAQDVFKELKSSAQVSYTPVKDQYMSSTCWSFASISLFESELLRVGHQKEDISEIFISRYSYINKINLHLQQKGGNYFTPGGQFHDVLWVMKNYGMMPESAYNGLAGNTPKHDHAKLDTAIKHYVERLVQQKVTVPTAGHWNYINNLLDKYLGRVPASFTYKGQTYTPQTYMTGYLGIKPEDYIELTSYSHHPWYTAYVLEDKYNWSSEKYYNLPFTDLQAVVTHALTNGYSVLWSGQVQDAGFHYAQGYAALKDTTGNLAAFRQNSFIDKTTAQDHLMHVVGIYTDEQQRTWYQLKNSWGDTNNNGGFLYMNEDYFFTKGVNFTVNKNAMPEQVRKKMK